MSPRSSFSVLVLSLALGACVKGDYVGAAVTAGLGVAGAGAHRASTKGCWGQCLNGLVCDHESGTCVEPRRCGGKCSRGETCDESTVIARCVSIVEMPTRTQGIEQEVDGGLPEASTEMRDE